MFFRIFALNFEFKKNMIKTTFFPCGSGEFIWINITENENKHVNILIDSGFKAHYEPYIKNVLEKVDKIDLWVLSHTDEDHIGGIIKLIDNGDENLITQKVNKIWFNWSSLEIRNSSSNISVKQAILLRDKLYELGKLHNVDIDNNFEKCMISNVVLSILSPTTEKLKLSKTKWQHEEQSKISTNTDYNIQIENLIKKPFQEDESVWNGGSIAFLLEWNDKKILFLADAHPSVIIKSLMNKPFEISNENPLNVDCVKVAHHGSKANTSFELLNLINCKDWIFCANGTKHGFPHKECISKIINNYKGSKEKTRIFLNHKSPTFDNIFGIDNNPKENYNFDFINLNGIEYII